MPDLSDRVVLSGYSGLAVLAALLCIYLSIHELRYGGPVYSYVERGLIGLGIGLATILLTVTARLWVTRPPREPAEAVDSQRVEA